jgi:hypothetical protein
MIGDDRDQDPFFEVRGAIHDREGTDRPSVYLTLGSFTSPGYEGIGILYRLSVCLCAVCNGAL